jgi:hypothetical protein
MKEILDASGKKIASISEPGEFPRPSPEELARIEAEIDAEADALVAKAAVGPPREPSTWLD